MEMQSQKLERLLTNKHADWANLPKTGSMLGLTIPAGHRSILVERATGCIILSDEGKPITRPEQVQFQRANRYNRGLFREHVGYYEGHVTYMYLDSEGHVTVGLGHLIPKVEDAMEMKFYERGTTIPAHPAHIENAFNKVLNSRLTDSRHTDFKDMSHVDLDLTEIESLFDRDVAQFLNLLKKRNYFPDFETYPAGAQLGMLDIAYSMGVDDFHDVFKRLHAALDIRNWIGIADQSGREVKKDKHGNPGIMAERNEVVRGWFLEAIKDQPFFLNPGCTPKKLSMIPG